jgi:hypothetical protein
MEPRRREDRKVKQKYFSLFSVLSVFSVVQAFALLYAPGGSSLC